MLVSIIALLLASSSCVSSHIMMRYPPSRRSKYSTYYTANNLINYDLKSPLNVPVGNDFFTFPCKGFPKGPSTATITGNEVRVTLEGTATHGGGHCQFGISYDDKTFVVLKTVINNCLLDTMSYVVQFPRNLSNQPVTLFWTWVNAIGNREYYMECADINIINGNSGSQQVVGKSLVIVNLPGFPTIPEFPLAGMYDARELFLNAATISINPNSPNNSPSQSRPTLNTRTTTTTTTTTTAVTQQTQSCINGHMKCAADGGFSMCSNSEWVHFKCAPGTECKQSDSSIVCDFVDNVDKISDCNDA
jgi:hypothetical protein